MPFPLRIGFRIKLSLRFGLEWQSCMSWEVLGTQGVRSLRYPLEESQLELESELCDNGREHRVLEG